MHRFTRSFYLTFLLMLGMGLSGCATLTGANNAASAAVQAGIELVTSLYIQHKGGGTAAGNAAVAQELTSVANTLQGVATGNLTVAQFNATMAPYIAKLNPTQQILATELLTLMDSYFATQVGANGGLLGVTTQAAVNLVLNDVKAACAFYLQAPALKAFKAPS